MFHALPTLVTWAGLNYLLVSQRNPSLRASSLFIFCFEFVHILPRNQSLKGVLENPTLFNSGGRTSEISEAKM